MKKLYLPIMTVLLAASILAGCGVSQADYDKVVSDLVAAQTGIASSETELAAAQTEIASLKSELATAQDQNANFQDELVAIEAEYNSLDSECTAIQTECTTVSATNDELVNRIVEGNVYKAILIELYLPSLTGDGLAEPDTIDKVRELVQETGDQELQTKFDTWAASPYNKMLAAEVVSHALLKMEEIVFE